MMEDFFIEYPLIATILLTIIITIIIIIPAITISYISSCKQAVIFNRLNNANYTCSDFFWAKDQINNQTQTIKLK